MDGANNPTLSAPFQIPLDFGDCARHDPVGTRTLLWPIHGSDRSDGLIRCDVYLAKPRKRAFSFPH